MLMQSLACLNCQLINTNDTFSSEDAFYVTRNTTIGIRLNSILMDFGKYMVLKLDAVIQLNCTVN